MKQVVPFIITETQVEQLKEIQDKLGIMTHQQFVDRIITEFIKGHRNLLSPKSESQKERTIKVVLNGW